MESERDLRLDLVCLALAGASVIGELNESDPYLEYYLNIIADTLGRIRVW